MTALRFGSPQSVALEARVPGDKSISHRALLFSACAQGSTTISGLNRGGDANATIGALRALGTAVEDLGETVRIAGGGFDADVPAIDCGNSGTTMRLLMGALAGRTACVLDGDASLRRRPMERVAAPLRIMGAAVDTAPGGVPPVGLRGASRRLRAIDYTQPVASAQVKSALLLAGLRAEGVTTIHSPQISRDHTERMLTAMGAAVRSSGDAVSIQPGPLRAIEELVVPGDPSAAIFFLVAAAAMRGAEMLIRSVCVNPTRIASFDIMRLMGVRLAVRERQERCGEPVATLSIKGGCALRAVNVAADIVPGLIDEIPALCALAALAEGEFVVRGAGELRVKESDRIASTVRVLRAFGADADEIDDGIIVRGGRELHPPDAIDTGGDHRIGMTAAALAAALGAPIEILNAACIATSFPDFAQRWSEAFGTTIF